jgi:hypothetical protein
MNAALAGFPDDVRHVLGGSPSSARMSIPAATEELRCRAYSRIFTRYPASVARFHPDASAGRVRLLPRRCDAARSTKSWRVARLQYLQLQEARNRWQAARDCDAVTGVPRSSDANGIPPTMRAKGCSGASFGGRETGLGARSGLSPADAGAISETSLGCPTALLHRSRAWGGARAIAPVARWYRQPITPTNHTLLGFLSIWPVKVYAFVAERTILIGV